MPMLEFAAAQPNFQNHLGASRAHALKNGGFLPNSCSMKHCKTFSPIWKPPGVHKKMRFENRPAKFVIEAVVTFELKCSDSRNHVGMSLDHSPAGGKSSSSGLQLDTSDGDDEELDEREKLRRKRISKANKGNTPWNKGRKHSAVTLQRIRERTRIAMQNPKIRMKLSKLGHVQTDETRSKIGASVRMGWERRRQALLVQETCYFEWQNLIAGASRRGYEGEDELLWDSYETLSEQLEKEWIESVEQRKAMPRSKGGRRAPKSPEQRRKIAEAIMAKWADPEYRERVCSGLVKYRGTAAGSERKPRRSPSSVTWSRRNSSPKKPGETSNAAKRDPAGHIRKAKQKKRNGPLFKDPLARSKLDMIKSIRAQRAASETDKIEAVQRARLLITEAERAAEALEIAALRSPVARASLIETRKLIAEAIESLESAGTESTSSKETRTYLSGTTLVPTFHDEGGATESLSIEPTGTKLNGTAAEVNGWKGEFDFGKFSLQQLLEASEEVHSDDYINGEQSVNQHRSLAVAERPPQPNGTEHAASTAPKKWIRGRLVEVAD